MTSRDNKKERYSQLKSQIKILAAKHKDTVEHNKLLLVHLLRWEENIETLVKHAKVNMAQDFKNDNKDLLIEYKSLWQELLKHKEQSFSVEKVSNKPPFLDTDVDVILHWAPYARDFWHTIVSNTTKDANEIRSNFMDNFDNRRLGLETTKTKNWDAMYTLKVDGITSGNRSNSYVWISILLHNDCTINSWYLNSLFIQILKFLEEENVLKKIWNDKLTYKWLNDNKTWDFSKFAGQIKDTLVSTFNAIPDAYDKQLSK